MNCTVCGRDTERRAIAGACYPCYTTAWESVAMDESDGAYASPEGVIEELAKMAVANSPIQRIAEAVLAMRTVRA